MSDSQEQNPTHQSTPSASELNSNGSRSRREFQRVPSATSLLPPTSDRGLTADDLIAHQNFLEAQAREIPYSGSSTACTHSKGYIRQPLWACRDCGGGVVCAGCSIGCHAQHDLIELFAKRHSRCDCGTTSLQRHPESQGRQLQPCNLRQPPANFAVQNDDNVYGKNHDGHFCYCKKGYTYDPHEEEETMFQCIVCEEWLHETCTSLRPKRATHHHQDSDGVQTKSAGEPTSSSEAQPSSPKDASVTNQDDDPPPLISHEAFDTLICDPCVRKYPILHHYVGTKQWGACLQLDNDDIHAEAHSAPTETTVLVNDHQDGPARYIVSGLPPNEEYGHSLSSPNRSHGSTTTLKRELSPIAESDDGGDQDNAPSASSKRIKMEHPTGETTSAQGVKQASPPEVSISTSDPLTSDSVSGCRLPPVNSHVKRLLSLSAPTTSPSPNNPDSLHRPSHRLDVFLDESNSDDEDVSEEKGYRRHICRCPSCFSQFKDLPFLLEDEYTYSPPASARGGDDADDNDDATSVSSHSSTYDMGMDALNHLPRAQTLEALEGYGRLRAALFDHLRPFAQSGKVVDEESIRAFFEEQRRRDRESG